MSKIPQTKEELGRQLEDQLSLLSVLAENYDAGKTVVAKSMATNIRVLVHDTSSSHSLLGQLGLKGGKFFDTSSSLEDSTSVDAVIIGSFCGLVGVAVGSSNQTYIPYLDDVPGNIGDFVEFDKYWNKVIFVDNDKNRFTRREIVLAVANQDGGAHVEPKLKEKYRKLARENTLGWKTSTDGKVWNDPQGSELAAVRQIGHEILRTFLPEYPKKKMLTTGNSFVIGGMGVLLTKTKEATEKVISRAAQKVNKVGRNEKCSCGSGQKYKKCHGR